MGFSNGTPTISTDGLVFAVDAGNGQSYVSASLDTFNLVGSQTGSLKNDTGFSSNNQGAWVLDGVDNYIDCGQISALAGATAFTISGWFKQTTLNQQRFLFGTYISSYSLIMAETWSDGQMYFEVKNGANTYASFDYSTLVTAGQWFHCAFAFDGSGAIDADKFKIYIDGALATLTTFLGTLPTSTNATQGDFLIGMNSNWGTQEWLGNISNTQIYNKSLTSSEALQNYNATKGRFI